MKTKAEAIGKSMKAAVIRLRPRLLVGLGGEHSLNHVLIGCRRRHVAQRRPDERRKEGVVARQYQLD